LVKRKTNIERTKNTIPTSATNFIPNRAQNIAKHINKIEKIVKERKKCSNIFNLLPKKKILQPKPNKVKTKYIAKFIFTNTRTENNKRKEKYK
jgi:hypothetical protein